MDTIRAEALCSLTGLTDRRHRQLAEQNYFPPPIRGAYQRDKTIAGLFKYFQEQIHARDDSLKIEQRELAIARKEKVREETEILRKAYVRKSEIGPALRNLSLHQRATLQFKLEQELAPNLVGLSAAEILERVRGAVDSVCAVFQAGTREWLGVEHTEVAKETKAEGKKKKGRK